MTAASAAALAGIAFSGPVQADPAAHLVATPDATAGAAYLATQLVDGDHLVFSFDGTTPDYGLTADTAIALAATGVGSDTVQAIADYLLTPAHIYDYASDPDHGAPASWGGPYPGSYAKLALVALTTGRDASALLTSLSALQCPALGAACASWEDGLFKNSNTNGFGFPGIFAQSFDVLAQQRGGNTASAQAGASFLRSQQCQDGSWANSVSDQSGGQCATGGNVDATAMAIQALVAVGTPDPDSTTALAEAVAWLQSQAGPGGGYASADAVVNANSTGLAAASLARAGADTSAPLGWLAGAQFGCSDTQVPVAALGSFSFTGIDSVSDSDTRATTAAVLGLVAANYLTVSTTGDAAAIPALTCSPAPTPSSPNTIAPTDAPTDASVPTPAAPLHEATQDLAATGSADHDLAVLGVGLLLTGFAAVYLARRRQLR